MLYKGTGFLTVVWYGSSLIPSFLSRQQVVYLSQSSCVSLVELTDGRGGGKRWGRSPIVPSLVYVHETSTEEPNHMMRESLVLFKSFNTLVWSLSCCCWPFSKTYFCVAVYGLSHGGRWSNRTYVATGRQLPLRVMNRIEWRHNSSYLLAQAVYMAPPLPGVYSIWKLLIYYTSNYDEKLRLIETN